MSEGMEVEDQICITLQLGVLKEHVTLSPLAPLDFLRDKGRLLVDKHAEASGSRDSLLLFRHDYNSPNLLQVLNGTHELSNGSVVEIVLSSNEDPTRPHHVQIHSYKAPTFCDYCQQILVGLVRQGLKCSKCGLNFHKKCAFAPHNNCSNSTGPGSGGSPVQQNFALPHTFVVHSYKRPTVCRLCNSLLVGIMKQGLQCRDCKVNVHKRCASQLPNDCHALESPSQRLSTTGSVSEQMETEEVGRGGEEGGLAERISTGDLIPLSRIPGQAATRSMARTRVIMEGWLLHFTNHQRDRRLRHYWVLEPGAVNLYSEGLEDLHRVYKIITMAEILQIRPYEGPPMDPKYPPHCFEISVAGTNYYVGENLEWYAASGQGGPPAAKLPRRESGMGKASAEKWLVALQKAMLPPPVAREPPGAEAALEFSQLYQVNQTEELGSGQFGTVYAGVHRQTKTRVAIKVIAKERFGRKQRDQLRSEVAILQAVSHPGIIHLESMFETKEKIFVVMEKMQADMLEMILSSRMGRLSERVTKFLILQILAALRYLHSKDIAHCDLKPENVLLSSSDTDFPQTKLCDFGYARFIGEAQFRNTVVGTPAYLAPEVLQRRGYNKSLDMWSVGVVIYVTLSGTFPFNEGEEISDQIQNAEFMYPDAPWKEISPQAISLIGSLLKLEKEDRPNIDAVLNCDWLRDAQLQADVAELEARVGQTYLQDLTPLPPSPLLP